MDRDSWNEILQIMLRKPIRTILASIGVGWGIMMLILLVGAGNGLENGTKLESAGVAENSMFIWSRKTSKPYKGFQRGRRIELDNTDFAYLKDNVAEITAISPRNQLGGYNGSNNVSYKSRTGAFNLYGDAPELIKIKPVIITQGRYLNEGDVLEKRKITVIGDEVRKVLFQDEDPIGQHIQANGINFKVVGVFKSMRAGEDGLEEMQSLFIPYTSFQKAFNWGDKIGWFSILCDNEKSVEELSKKVTSILMARKNVHPEDKRAFGSWNMGEEMGRFNQIFDAIDLIGYFVGSLVLLAGIIGIINIMLVTVKERTKEFGIRRALGAAPKTIINQVVKETLLLTITASSVGMILGVFLLKKMSDMTDSGDMGVFYHPEVSLKVVVMAMVLTITFGALAGLIPAIRAVSIKPVDAIRTET